jgi:hypothetical protein
LSLEENDRFTHNSPLSPTWELYLPTERQSNDNLARSLRL